MRERGRVNERVYLKMNMRGKKKTITKSPNISKFDFDFVFL